MSYLLSILFHPMSGREKTPLFCSRLSVAYKLIEVIEVLVLKREVASFERSRHTHILYL